MFRCPNPAFSLTLIPEDNLTLKDCIKMSSKPGLMWLILDGIASTVFKDLSFLDNKYKWETGAGLPECSIPALWVNEAEKHPLSAWQTARIFLFSACPQFPQTQALVRLLKHHLPIWLFLNGKGWYLLVCLAVPTVKLWTYASTGFNRKERWLRG